METTLYIYIYIHPFISCLNQSKKSESWEKAECFNKTCAIQANRQEEKRKSE